MPNEDSAQLREVISLLKQLLEQQQKETAYREQLSQSIGAMRPEYKFDPGAHERRLAEIMRDGEQRRNEDHLFREQLLAMLRQLNETLPRVMKRLDEIGEKRP